MIQHQNEVSNSGHIPRKLGSVTSPRIIFKHTQSQLSGDLQMYRRTSRLKKLRIKQIAMTNNSCKNYGRKASRKK